MSTALCMASQLRNENNVSDHLVVQRHDHAVTLRSRCFDGHALFEASKMLKTFALTGCGFYLST